MYASTRNLSPAARNWLLGRGALWGLCLAVVPAFVMANPLRPDGFLVAAIACALLGGAVGTLTAGRRTTARIRKGGRNAVLAGLGTGLIQGLVGGGVAALLFWGIMAFTSSGYAPGGTVDLSSLMRPQVFLGSFFVPLSVFLYTLAGGSEQEPAFGTLVNRAARGGAKGVLR